MTYQPIIGLEVHVELATKSKMFCGCPAEHFGKVPNSQTCPVCLGLPGALPVPNRKAIEWAIMLGLALGCKVNKISKFDRKNYFYPDLPKGYQISQYDEPLCLNGYLEISVPSHSGEDSERSVEDDSRIANVGDSGQARTKKIRIRRVHLEEDTGKLQHVELDGQKVSLVDFNRSGVPLVEIVTEPDFRAIVEVDQFLRKLQRIVRYLGISGADMEKGSMRLEPSISIAVQDTRNKRQDTGSIQLPNYRVELKNINSFRFARKALEYEISRQTELLSQGEKIIQQTRGWSESKNATLPQREKEEANDYRYFPEPDIPPMEFLKSYILNLKSQIPELPDTKSKRLQKEYHLTAYTAEILTADKTTAEFFEKALADVRKLPQEPEIDWPKEIANWLVNKNYNVSNAVPGDLIQNIIQAKTTTQITNEELDRIISEAFAQNPQAVSDYKKGKTQAVGVIIGAILKKTKLDSQKVAAQVRKKLESLP